VSVEGAAAALFLAEWCNEAASNKSESNRIESLSSRRRIVVLVRESLLFLRVIPYYSCCGGSCDESVAVGTYVLQSTHIHLAS